MRRTWVLSVLLLLLLDARLGLVHAGHVVDTAIAERLRVGICRVGAGSSTDDPQWANCTMHGCCRKQSGYQSLTQDSRHIIALGPHYPDIVSSTLAMSEP